MDKSGTLKLAEELIAYAIKGKIDDGVNDRYVKSKEYFTGEHKIKSKASNQGNKVVNKYAEIFESEISQITEALPKWHFKPQSNDDIVSADQLNQIIGDVIWDKNKWFERGEDAADEAAHAGACVISTRVGGDGYPYFDVLSNDQFFPDPLIPEHHKMRFCVVAIPETTSKIKRLYKKEVQSEDVLNTHSKTISLDQVLKSFEQQSSANMKFDMRSYRGGIGSFKFDNASDAIGMAITFHVYKDDDSKEKKPFEDGEAEQEHLMMLQGQAPVPSYLDNHTQHLIAHKQKLQELDGAESVIAKNLVKHIEQHQRYIEDYPEYADQRLKYPYGRRMIVCQGKLLSDAPLSVPIHWQEKFVKWDWVKKKGSYWGKGLGHDLFDPQDLFNHRSNAITQNINSVNYGLTKIRSGAFAKDKKVSRTNQIGQVVTVPDPVRDIVRDFGPSLPSSHWNDLQWLEGFMERKAGQGGLKSGRLPAGSPAGVTVETLLQQGMKPSNAVVRRYSSALRQMARNAMVIMSEYVPENEKFLITGKDPKEIRWGDIKDFGYKDIRVDVLGQMTTSRDRQLQTALLMKQYGVYDVFAVLDAIDDPKKFEVLNRMNEQQELKNYIVQQESTIGILQDELKKSQSEINTLSNRLQGSDGSGNVGNQGKD